MKTVITIIATAILTWLGFSIVQAVRTGTERLWLVSAIKVPGKTAIADIQADMDAGRYDVAKIKLQTFMEIWNRFDSGPDSFHGPGIGDVMIAFSKFQTNESFDIKTPKKHDGK